MRSLDRSPRRLMTVAKAVAATPDLVRNDCWEALLPPTDRCLHLAWQRRTPHSNKVNCQPR